MKHAVLFTLPFLALSLSLPAAAQDKSKKKVKKLSEQEVRDHLDEKKNPASGEYMKRMLAIWEQYKSYAPGSAAYNQQMSEHHKTSAELDSIRSLHLDHWQWYREYTRYNCEMEGRYNTARSAMDGFYKNVIAQCGNPLEQAEKISGTIKEDIDRKKSEGKGVNRNAHQSERSRLEFLASCSDFLSGKDSGEAMRIREIHRQCNALVEEAHTASLAQREEQQAAKLQKSKEILAEKERATLEKAEAPPERYSGADKATLKSKVTSAWANDTQCGNKYNVLKVYITGESWTREKGYDYRRSSDSFRKYDDSFLSVAVIVQPRENADPEIAYTVRYELIKDHINDGRIHYDNFDCSTIRRYRILAAKIK